jgi:hypothetical protein
MLSFNKGDYASAAQAYQALLPLVPTNVDAYINLGMLQVCRVNLCMRARVCVCVCVFNDDVGGLCFGDCPSD